MAPTDMPATRRPVFAYIGICCPLLAVPLARIAADLLVTGEDLVGYYGLWTGLLTMVIAFAIGIIATGLSFWRAEHPRVLSVAAAVVNAAAVLILIIMMP